MQGATERATFERTTEQRMTALEKANAVRRWRAQLKRDMKARRLRAHELLREPPEMIHSMKVLDLLLAAPKIGRTKAMRMLTRAGVSPSRSVGALSDRQRQMLLAALPQG